MDSPPIHQVLQQIRRLAGTSPLDDASDGKLLERFVGRRDQPAFSELVRRHGPMVLSVCRQLLRDPHAAEDAFQATFLVLVRRAPTLEKRPYLGSWLYGVACRTARKARAALQRWARERQARTMPPTADQNGAPTTHELQPILTEELDGLPEKYRAPLVLCYLQGKSTEDAARHIGCPRGTILSRLSRARDLLRTRLARRGLPLTATALPVALAEHASAALPPALFDATVTAGLALAAGKVPATTSIATLTDAVLKEMLVHKLRAAAAAALVLALLGVGAMLAWPAAQPDQKAPLEAKVTEPPAERPLPVNERTTTDVFGDPLPPGVLVRLGTVRFRTGERIERAVLSPNGKYLAVSGYESIFLLEVATGQSRPLLRGNRHGHCCAAFTPDSKALVTSDGWTLALWDVASATKTRHLHGPQVGPQDAKDQAAPGAAKGSLHLGSLALSADGKLLAVAAWSDGQQVVCLWKVATGQEAGKWMTEPAKVMDLQFSPDGKMLACVEASNKEWSIQLRDPTSGKVLRTLTSTAGIQGPVAFASDNRTVAAGARDNQAGVVILWDAATGQELARLAQPAAGNFYEVIRAVTFSPDGKTLAWGGWDRVVHVWDVATRKEARRLQGGVMTVANSLAFSPDGARLYAAGEGMIRVWDTAQGKEVAPFNGHGVNIESVAWRDGGRSVVTFSQDQTCRMWDTATAKETGRSGELKSKVMGVSTFNPAATLVLTCHHEENELLVWDVPSGTNRLKIAHDPDDGLGGRPAFSPDGRVLAASMGHSVCLFDVANGKVEKRLLENKERFRNVVWSPDRRYLAIGGEEKVHVVEVASGKVVRTLSAPESSWDFAFSPDGRMLAEGGRDAQLRLWEMATGKLRRTKKLDKSTAAYHLAWSPDSRTLAWAGPTANIELWNVAEEKSLGRLVGHGGRVHCLAFSPDGQRLLSGSEDTTALIWDLKSLRAPAKPVCWKDAELASLWTDLANEDAGKAFDAAARFAAAPEQSPPMFGQQLAPVALPDRQRLARLLADLDSAEFAVRQQAGEALEKLGDVAEPALRQALDGKPSLEFRQRIERLLEKLTGPVTDAATLRALRAVEVLEQIGTPAAKQVIMTLAKGADGARLTREAKASLERLR